MVNEPLAIETVNIVFASQYNHPTEALLFAELQKTVTHHDSVSTSKALHDSIFS